MTATPQRGSGERCAISMKQEEADHKQEKVREWRQAMKASMTKNKSEAHKRIKGDKVLPTLVMKEGEEYTGGLRKIHEPRLRYWKGLFN